MLQALRTLSVPHPFTIDIIDVDSDESLVAQYDELVPVLIGCKNGTREQLCHYFLDEAKVRAFLVLEEAPPQHT